MILSSASHSIEVIAKKQFVALAVPRVAIPRHHIRIIFLASLLILLHHLPMAKAQSTHEVEMGNRFGLSLGNNGPAGDPGSGTTSQTPPPETFEVAFDIQSNGKQIKHSCAVCHWLEVQIDGKRYQAGEVATLRGNQTYDITVLDTPRPLPPNAVTPPHPPEAYTARFTVYPMAVGNQTISEVSRATGSSPTPNDSPQAFIASKDEVLQYLIENTEGLFVRDKKWPENPADEPMRKKATIQHFPVDIAVDGNRDGAIQFASTQGASVDKTTANKPFRFWVNDDSDGIGDGEENGQLGGFLYNDLIKSKRDLEDFTRLYVNIGAFYDEIGNGTFTIGLKWRDTNGTNPKVKVYRSADPEGSNDYLKTDAAATAQMSGVYRTTLGEVSASSPLILSSDAWTGYSAANPKKCFIFESTGEGKGQLCITIHKANGTLIGEGPGVWLDLLNVKKMYARATATPDTLVKPFESNSSTFDDSGFNFTAESYTPPSDEERKALIFVHGWSMSNGDFLSFSETMFKRLWHQGFKGRFCAFRWATLTSLDSYNTSEYRAWKYGRSLKNYVASLQADYVISIAAHSMGNVVAGSALRRGMSINRYFLMQAALPGGCFSDSVNGYSLFTTAEQTSPTPDTVSDLGYRLYLQDSYSRAVKIINFSNQFDFALATGTYPVVGNTNWEQNQISYKPDANATLHGNKIYAYDAGPPTNPYPAGLRCFVRNISPPFSERSVTDNHESMAFVARPRSRAIGAEPNSASVFPTSINLTSYGYAGDEDDHSAQFARRIQRVGDFYRVIVDEVK